MLRHSKGNRFVGGKFRAVAARRSIPAIGNIALVIGAADVGLGQLRELARLPAIVADHEAVTVVRRFSGVAPGVDRRYTGQAWLRGFRELACLPAIVADVEAFMEIV